MCYGCYDLAADLVMTASSSLSFHPIPGQDTAYRAWLGDKPVGRIMWAGGDAPDGVPPYQVQHIDVHPDHLRQGIATSLFNHVQQNVEPRLRHSDQLSESGEAFARSMGHTAAWNGTTAKPSPDLHEIHYHNGRGWNKVPMPSGTKVRTSTQTAERTADMQFPYLRNNGGMRNIPGFDQDIEPWGRYMSPDLDEHHLPLQQGWERGNVGFSNPLYVPHNYGGWKQELSDAHGGLTGHDLSDALLAKGHDGVISHDKYGIGEIVDIRPKDQRGHHVGIS